MGGAAINVGNLFPRRRRKTKKRRGPGRGRPRSQQGRRHWGQGEALRENLSRQTLIPLVAAKFFHRQPFVFSVTLEGLRTRGDLCPWFGSKEPQKPTAGCREESDTWQRN